MYSVLFNLTLILSFIAPVFIIKYFHIGGIIKRIISYVVFFFVILIIGSIIADQFKTDAERAEDAKREKLAAIEQAHQDSIQAIQDSIDWYESDDNKINVKVAAECFIQNNLNNPDSYEKVALEIMKEEGTHYVVYVKYRGTNAFGGIVTNSSLVEVVSDYETKSCRAIGFVTKL